MENTVMEDRCPICLDRSEEASYVVPCLHQFCYPCITRWAESKPKCPLCKRKMRSILHSVQADNKFEEYVLPSPTAPSVIVHETGGASRNPSAHTPHQSAAPQQPLPLGGFYAYVWASIFRVYPAVLHPLLPWLHQELQQLLEPGQDAATVQSLVVSSLRFFGLDKEALIHLLQVFLGRHTRIFVQRLVNTAVQRCSRRARYYLGLEDARDAVGQDGSSESIPSHPAS